MENKNIDQTEQAAKSGAPQNETAVIRPLVYKKRFWLVLGLIFMLAAAALLFVNYKLFTARDIDRIGKGESKDEDIYSSAKTTVRLARRLIDGVFVRTGSENIYPVAVMIENHIDARPPAALSKANLVFEAEAEGSITRFLAVYADGEEIKEIGPVRSARPYYLDWAREFDALYIHCGGSPDALARIKQDGIKSLNEFYNGAYYWRDKTRPAPHNIFTSSENLKKAAEKFGPEKAVYESWKYKNDAPAEARPEAASVKIGYRAKPFAAAWEYAKGENAYLRIMGGEPHKDSDGSQITAKNVVIIFVKTTVIDDELRVKMETVGRGQAIICLDGRCQEGEWRKPDPAARTRFFLSKQIASIDDVKNLDDDYIEAEFNAGTTWIEVVRPEYEVSY